MTDKKTRKPNQPELIEDGELDEASGGLLPAVKPTSSTAQGWPSKIDWPSGDLKFSQPSAHKIEIGALKAGSSE